MRQKIRTWLGGCTAGLAVLGTVMAPATPAYSAAGTAPLSGANGLVWESYRSQPYTAGAGERCPFPIHAEPVLDEERIATLTTYPDGRPKRQVITGDLRFRFTNLDSGDTVEHDLNGTAFIDYGTDGSVTYRTIGAVSSGFRATDPHPMGIWKLDGYHELYIAPNDSMREIRVDGGTEHNICGDLD